MFEPDAVLAPDSATELVARSREAFGLIHAPVPRRNGSVSVVRPAEPSPCGRAGPRPVVVDESDRSDAVYATDERVRRVAERDADELVFLGHAVAMDVDQHLCVRRSGCERHITARDVVVGTWFGDAVATRERHRVVRARTVRPAGALNDTFNGTTESVTPSGTLVAA